MAFLFLSSLIHMEFQVQYPRDCVSVDLQLSLGVCILTGIPADSYAGGPGTKLWKTVLRMNGSSFFRAFHIKLYSWGVMGCGWPKLCISSCMPLFLLTVPPQDPLSQIYRLDLPSPSLPHTPSSLSITRRVFKVIIWYTINFLRTPHWFLTIFFWLDC